MPVSGADEIVGSPTLIVEKYFDMVYRLARKVAGADKADDTVQNVFMRYMSHCREFDTEEHIKAWLIRVTYNCAKSELKNPWNDRTVAFADDTADPVLVAELEPPGDERAQALSQAVDMLPSKYRTVVHLYYYEEYSTKEIAGITNQKEATVRSLLARGRKRLEKLLEGGG